MGSAGSSTRRCFKRATSSNPQSADAHVNLGVLLREQGRIDEAEQAFQRAADPEPNGVNAWCGLADVRLLLGQRGRIVCLRSRARAGPTLRRRP